MTAAYNVAYDVVVIGGGPAGLSAALWAARYRRRVLLVDAGEPRNRAVEASHGYLGADGIAPRELLERARADLRRYPGVDRHDGRVVAAAAAGDGFRVELDRGEPVRAARIVLATGVCDVFPDVGGFFEHYGASVFTCPSCDGYEAQGRPVVVLGHEEHVAAFALGLLDWASAITIVTNGRPFGGDDRHRDALARHGIAVVEGEVARLAGPRGDLRAAVLRDGTEIECTAAFFSLDHGPRAEIIDQLGCRTNDEGCVVVDDDNETSVPGVYAAGDIIPGPHLIQVAAAAGAVAGIAAAQSLRGETGVAASPPPAPDAAAELPA